MSDSVRPHRRQPPRLPCPWDSPGKNTGVGCHFLLQCMKVKSEREVAQSCLTLSDPMDCSPPGCSVHGDSPGKNTGAGCHALLQGIFLTQGSNPSLPHCRWTLYHLSHQGSPDRTAAAAAAAKSLQSCPTLCDPIDGSPPGSPIPGILQARTLIDNQQGPTIQHREFYSIL